MSIVSYSARIETESSSYLDVVRVEGTNVFGVSAKFGLHALVLNKNANSTELYSLPNTDWLDIFSDESKWKVVLLIKNGVVQEDHISKK